MITSQSPLSTDFDWHQLRQLAGEDADFEVELLTIFLQDAEHNLKQLEDAIAARHLQAVEEVAHSLRGASANVGASALARVAQQLEQLARAGQLTGAATLLGQLKSHSQQIQTHIRTCR